MFALVWQREVYDWQRGNGTFAVLATLPPEGDQPGCEWVIRAVPDDGLSYECRAITGKLAFGEVILSGMKGAKLTEVPHEHVDLLLASLPEFCIGLMNVFPQIHERIKVFTEKLEDLPDPSDRASLRFPRKS